LSFVVILDYEPNEQANQYARLLNWHVEIIERAMSDVVSPPLPSYYRCWIASALVLMVMMFFFFV
jgi:hypothetical protein